MRVLVCGGRGYNNAELLSVVLFSLHVAEPITTVIEGSASGADRMAREWAVRNNIPVETYPADWERYGKAAGGIRNRQMLVEGKPDCVVAFPGNKGTANMIGKTKGAGISLYEIFDQSAHNGAVSYTVTHTPARDLQEPLPGLQS